MRKPNPDYGNGVYRRRVRLRVAADRVLVELEDSNHAFRVRVGHDGRRVTEVSADTVRHPFVTCKEAQQPLQRLLGCGLDEDAAGLRGRLVPGDNCTHLHDMAMLAMAHSGEPGLERLYDITVADEREGVTAACIACDGHLVHAWQISGHEVAAPQAYAGRPMMRGFYAWVSAEFSAMPLEAAVALQRGYFVAQSRRQLNRPAVDNPATADHMPDGACYSYNHGVVGRALRVEGSVWDLTDAPGYLLQFRPRP